MNIRAHHGVLDFLMVGLPFMHYFYNEYQKFEAVNGFVYYMTICGYDSNIFHR